MSLALTLKKLEKEKRQTLEVIMKGDKGDPGLDAHTPTDKELLALIRPLIPPPIKGDKGEPGNDGNDGHTPTAQEILAFIKPLIPKVRNGQDGHTPTKAELVALIKSVMPVPKDGSPDTPQEIKQKLIELPIREPWFDARHIKNLPTELRRRGGIVKGGVAPLAYDLSSLLDGSTKSFAIPPNNGILLVTGSGAPFIFRPTVDFTGTGTTTLTFTSGVDAPSALAAGQTLMILYIG